ncbi:hypothetical protein Anas_03042 [Armadillidium nasatum]|uniref:Uncharacterized protein n=1 Tax=Armadillidium nasatum TaxID=96803 RepID=A0A5N5TL91_9CRUS|nr:hypothetical protein Anas_03042 [Armadillidium nasatum]
MSSKQILIPQIWDTLKTEGPEADMSGLLNIWEARLRHVERKTDSKPSCVTFMKMINLTPQDAPHPLYSPDYGDQTDNFILDHLCMDEISCDDEKLGSAEGVILKTMSGKDLVFKKREKSETLSVNNIEIEGSKTLSDGTQVFVLTDFSFNHYDELQESFKHISANTPNRFCPIGEPCPE